MNDPGNTTKKSSQATPTHLIEEQRGFVIESFKNGLKFAERLSKTAATLPWTLLESMGVSEEKTRGPKEFNLKLVNGVFGLTNKMAARALAIIAAPAQWRGNKPSAAETAPTRKTSGSNDTGASTRTTTQSKAGKR